MNFLRSPDYVATPRPDGAANILQMADIASWREIASVGWRFIQRGLPSFVMRQIWPQRQLLAAIEIFHFDQAPRFHISRNRDIPELGTLGFNVFNLTPVRLALVGADLRISVNSQEWCSYSQRFPAELTVSAFSRGGFHFACPLAPTQADLLRRYESNWIALRIAGSVVIRALGVELRKDIHCDIIAVIQSDRMPAPFPVPTQ